VNHDLADSSVVREGGGGAVGTMRKVGRGLEEAVFTGGESSGGDGKRKGV